MSALTTQAPCFFFKKLFTQMFKNVEFPSLYSKGYKTGLVVSTHLA